MKKVILKKGPMGNLLLGFAFVMVLYFSIGFLVQKDSYYTPKQPKEDITSLLDQSQFSEEDYQTLYAQTGIAKPMVNEIKKFLDFKERMLRYQNFYYSHITVKSEHMNPFTLIDYGKDDHNPYPRLFELAPYRNGYIFLNKSTTTLNWRHGHAGIVIDDKRGKVLESLQPGTISIEQDVSKWTYYPTFIMMRPKDTSYQKMDEIAAYADKYLRNVPYSIFAMKNQGDIISSTQCSHLVWQAYKAFGMDIDSNGGIFVSPKDISGSEYLEVLQIFGINPDKRW